MRDPTKRIEEILTILHHIKASKRCLCSFCLLWTCSFLSLPSAHAQEILMYSSLYTTHFRTNDGLNNHQHLIGIEYQNSENWIFGINEFKNSYNQQTEYLYIGKRWHPLRYIPNFYTKLSAGALHGYIGDHRKKIPFNGSSTAPAIIPAIGFSYSFMNVELTTFYAGAMLLGGLRF